VRQVLTPFEGELLEQMREWQRQCL
jgi:hypothetical protein